MTRTCPLAAPAGRVVTLVGPGTVRNGQSGQPARLARPPWRTTTATPTTLPPWATTRPHSTHGHRIETSTLRVVFESALIASVLVTDPIRRSPGVRASRSDTSDTEAMADESHGDTNGAEPVAKPSESLSQFVAKVLDQLSLSAWLPSAALVLSVSFLVNFRAKQGAFGDSVRAFGTYTAADGFFLFAAAVVLTVVTQAFEFEAIQFFEGYWGPKRIGELAADIGCAFQLWRRDSFDCRRRKVDGKAFERAHYRLSLLVQANPSSKAVSSRDLEILLARRLS